MPRKGNGNAISHGVRSYLATGRLPSGAEHIRKMASCFRRALEEAVLERRPEISLHDACVIQTATRHFVVCELWERWLADSLHSLALPDRLAVTKAICVHSERRDEALRALGLNISAKQSIVDALYGPVREKTASSAPEAARQETNGHAPEPLPADAS